MKSLSQYKLIFLVSVCFTFFYNFSFFKNVLDTYSFEGLNILYIFTLGIVMVCFNTLLFTFFSSKYTTKPLLILTLMVTSFSAYFMNTYNIIIDTDMIRNILQTNIDESSDLFSLKLVAYVIVLGLVPSFLVYKIKINYYSLKKELFSKAITIILSVLTIVIIVFACSKFYTSFFREHKSLRYHINPTYWIYSIGNYINKTVNAGPIKLKTIENDAKVSPKDIKSGEKELIIMVVGEAARADRFSLNGYSRKTNPLLEKENVINFSNMYSCGTSTAVSVPCMFSIFSKADYSYKKGISTQNVIDVLTSTKDINVLWRDNNSSSKGVATRVEHQNYKTSKLNTICDDGECRDEGMLVGLDKYIQEHKDEDILIVLHQMGSHGPAYYKRYPKEFEKFTPVCKTNELEKCSKEEISNAYDNTILYTDYFLSKVINFLKPYSNKFETAMLYMSDHGESLGENGVYLHGMPYFMAPESQIHIGSMLWLGDGEIGDDYDIKKLKSYANKRFTQDNLFHTLLGLFEVETKVYNKNMDILNDARISK